VALGEARHVSSNFLVTFRYTWARKFKSGLVNKRHGNAPTSGKERDLPWGRIYMALWPINTIRFFLRYYLGNSRAASGSISVSLPTVHMETQTGIQPKPTKSIIGWDCRFVWCTGPPTVRGFLIRTSIPEHQHEEQATKGKVLSLMSQMYGSPPQNDLPSPETDVGQKTA
jgi:hypothetical protein